MFQPRLKKWLGRAKDTKATDNATYRDMSRRFPRLFAAESSQGGCNTHDGTKSSGKVAKLAGERSTVEHGKYLGIVEPIPRKGRASGVRGKIQPKASENPT